MVESIKTLLKANGFEEDRWCRFKKIVNIEGKKEEIRYKFNDTSLRKEVKLSPQWIRISGGYYKDLSIIDGKIHGLTR